MTILHLDRSQFIRKVVMNAGQIDSVDFVSCDSISEALNILNNQEIEMIITAQQLSDGSAEDFLSKIDESDHQYVPIIILTADDTIELREKYFDLGVIDYITKASFTPDRLKRHINFFQEQDEILSMLKKASIAILDDSILSINMITSIIRMQGMRKIQSFTDPQELYDCDKEFNIYFIDLVLPGISGESMVVELRRRYPQAVIIAISSLDKYNTIVHVLESGADDYIVKPFDARLLMARLKSNFRQQLAAKKIKLQSDKLKELTITDSLTGAKNHRYLFERLEAEISQAKRSTRPLSLLLLDLDRFKKINDTFGHPLGDQVLKTLSKLFIENCRKYDIFGRYGGEEFMLIMPDTPRNGAFKISDRLRDEFSKIEIDGIDEKITFSGGLVEWNDETSDEILTKVDNLLYQAKEDGRNNIKTVTIN